MPTKILIVEDDPAARRLLSFTLESAGYHVIEAANGLEGLQKAQHEAPALVVLDVMLPGIDGFEVCHRLRSAAWHNVPVLMLSAKAQASDRRAGKRVGADLYLTKPATPQDITAAVGDLLRQSKAA